MFIGAFGAFTGGLVVICIKRLQTTEPTRVIMFYYALWNTILIAIPAAIWWVTPTPYEFAILCMIGFLGISGQSLITHGLSQGEATVLMPLDYSRIIYSAIVGYLLFSEVPGPWSFAGMALIVGGLALSRADGEEAVAAGEAAGVTRNHSSKIGIAACGPSANLRSSRFIDWATCGPTQVPGGKADNSAANPSRMPCTWLLPSTPDFFFGPTSPSASSRVRPCTRHPHHRLIPGTGWWLPGSSKVAPAYSRVQVFL